MINRCTDICGRSRSRGRSCSKIYLVKVFIAGNPKNFLKMNALFDDQSNHFLGHSELSNYFKVPNNLVPSELKTCFGTTAAIGGHVRNLVIKSFDGIVHLLLPELTEYNAMSCNSSEIPTPKVVRLHSCTHVLSLKCFSNLTQK